MISKIKVLTRSPHKSVFNANLFDFIEKRENMNLCGSENLQQNHF